MLDPFTSISLASSIVQFVDFGIKTISRSRELYYSSEGLSAQNARLDEIVADIDDQSARLTNIPPVVTNAEPPSDDERAIRKLAESSKGIASELFAILDSLRVQMPRKKWQSSRKAFASIWKADKIRELEKRLRGLQEQINRRLIFMMRTLNRIDNREIDELKLEALLTTLRSVSKDELDKLRTDIQTIIDRLDPLLQRQFKTAVDGSRSTLDSTMASSQLPKKLHVFAERGFEIAKEQKLLGTLRFRAMGMRQTNITKAHQETLGWIYEDVQSGSRPHLHFKEWLRNHNNVYWIAGKAGSGKSTLMKYLSDEPRTKDNLMLWAGPDRLFTASFFFWNAGNAMQKSQQGLLQSLLHEVLSQCKDLIPRVCPHRWQLEDSLNYDDIEPWTRKELLEAFDRLAKQDLSVAKFCFFVDGLDEYDGDHAEIINTLKGLANLSNVKICLSSRPWNKFVDAFGADTARTLTLQDFTRDDIELYVRNTLGDDEHFARLENLDPTSNDLVQEIVNLAQGVFLWVTLVVRSLLQGLTNADDISDLQRRLRSLPPELEPYFQHILESIDEFYREQTSQIFQMAIQAAEPLSMVVLAFVEKEQRSPDYALEIECRPMTDTEITQLYQKTKKRLNARCKDLLEVTVDPEAHLYFRYKIDFLHRTVRDFLEQPHMCEWLARWSTEKFNPQLSFCKALLAQLKMVPGVRTESEKGKIGEIFDSFMKHACDIDLGKDASEIKHLEALYYTQSGFQRSVNGTKHWTSDLVQQRFSDCSTFLPLAVDVGLLSYVRHALDTGPQLIQEGGGYPLLDIALTHVSRIRFPGRPYGNVRNRDHKMVKLLLEKGANPNKVIPFGGTHASIWAKFLQTIWWEMEEMRSNGSNTYERDEQLCQLIETLLAHGANTDLRIFGLDGNANHYMTPLEIVQRLFRAQDIAPLARLLEPKRTLSIWQRFARTKKVETVDFRTFYPVVDYPKATPSVSVTL